MENHPDAQARLEQLEYERAARYLAKIPEELKYIKIKKLSTDAILPTQSNSTDAGWDLYAKETVTMSPQRPYLISTGIAMAIPKGYVGLIWPRSGLAVKKGIDVYAGVIDSGYRGEIKVCLWTNSINPDWGCPKALDIQKGDRIAQILFQQIGNFALVEAAHLDDTDRSSGGFGSTGI